MSAQDGDTCPGCDHSRGAQVCCDACWKRPPTNLPGAPRWRSRRRSLSFELDSNYRWEQVEAIDRALIIWLRNNRLKE